MKLELNIEDYLSEEKLTEIVEDEVRYAVRSLIRNENDVERIISNLSYEFIFKAISDEWDIDATQMIKDGVYKVLNTSNSINYEMFRSASFGDSEGPAVKPLREACEELRPLMKEMAEKHIREYPFQELDMEYLQDTIGEVIVDALVDKQKKNEESGGTE